MEPKEVEHLVCMLDQKEEIERLREALKEIEYINKICPFCFYKEGDGHMEDCQLVILEVVEEGGGE